MQNMVFHASIRGLLEKHWFMPFGKALVYGGFGACANNAVESSFLKNECGGVRLF